MVLRERFVPKHVMMRLEIVNGFFFGSVQPGVGWLVSYRVLFQEDIHV